jgi:hypothetical protein
MDLSSSTIEGFYMQGFKKLYIEIISKQDCKNTDLSLLLLLCDQINTQYTAQKVLHRKGTPYT